MRNESADSLDKLKRALADNAESLLLELFGEPASKSKRDWRWGSKGSLVVYFGGRNGPTFHSYEAEQGGSLLDAIMFLEGCTFPAAIGWARAWLGDEPHAPRRRNLLPKPRQAFNVAKDEKKRVEAARALWSAGRSIDGTAAERYLKRRAIDRWPVESVRFIGARDAAAASGWGWWRWPAVLFPATDGAGCVRAVQLVALNDDGSAVPHWDGSGRKLKLSRGSMAGTAVRLPGASDGPVMLCEGPETALSVWLACQEWGGFEAWANLGSIAKAPLEGVPKNLRIVVCRDDDPRNAQSRLSLDKKIREWRREGRTVYAVSPWRLSRGDKTDFNDLLKASGVEAIRRRFDEALIPRTLPDEDPTEEARLQLDRAVQSAFADLMTPHEADEPQPFHVIRASLGLGKTEAALRACGDAIRRGHAVAYFVPNHKLTEELRRRAEEIFAGMGIGARVRIWRGREQPDPTDSSKNMCVNGVAAKAAQHAHLSVRETVCDVCPHMASCAYLLQAEDFADLWILPTSMLWLPRPANMKNVSLAVIDERFGLDGMVGIEGAPLRVAREELETPPTHGSGRPAATADLRADLMPLRRKLLGALLTHPTGPMERSSLLAARLTAQEAQKASKLEGERLMKVSPRPGITEDELLQEIRRADGNSAVDSAIMMWREVARLLDDQSGRHSGRADVECEDGKFQSVRLYGAKKRGKGWDKVPTLHMDATADMTLIKARVPHARLWADVRASMPFTTVSQHIGRTFSKTDLTNNPQSLRDAWLWCVHRATHAGGKWLLVTYKAAEEAIRERFKVPDFLELAHFGAVAGRDEWRDVRGIIVLGRPQCGQIDVERRAGAVTAYSVPAVDGWYPTETVTVLARDGTSVTVAVDKHPDHMAEAVRRTICEAELMQAIGRPRGVNRDRSRPLDIVILGNVPLPLKVDTLADWRPLAFDDAMLAEFGVVLSSSADAAKVAQVGDAAIRQARARHEKSKPVTFPYKNIYTGLSQVCLYVPRGSHCWSSRIGSLVYRRQGSRGPASEAAYDVRRIPDPVRGLEAFLGQLVVERHFDPLRPSTWGGVDLAFASHYDQGENLSDEERRAIVPDDCR